MMVAGSEDAPQQEDERDKKRGERKRGYDLLDFITVTNNLFYLQLYCLSQHTVYTHENTLTQTNITIKFMIIAIINTLLMIMIIQF